MKLLYPSFKFFRLLALIITFLIAPSMVSAHTGIDLHNSWLHGFSHPLSGLDHVLAMIAVGLWAAQVPGRIIWLIPVFFYCYDGIRWFLGKVYLAGCLRRIWRYAVIAGCGHIACFRETFISQRKSYPDRIICTQPRVCTR